MLNHIKNLICGLLAALMMFSVFPLPAFAAEYSDEVKISLETTTDGKANYYPGADTGYTLTLKNERGPVWVRVKIDTGKENFSPDFSEENFTFTDNWVKRGGYWYYTEGVDSESDLLVITGMRIPESDYTEAGAVLTVTANADAVQYDAIDPDFSLEEPWQEKEPDYHTSTSSLGRSASSNSSSGSYSGSRTTTTTDTTPNTNSQTPSTENTPGTGSANGPVTYPDAGETSTNSDTSINPVNTGEETPVWVYACIAGAVILAGAILILGKENRRNER